jgi:hypothetical protein
MAHRTETEGEVPKRGQNLEQATREAAYHLWEREGRPDGQALEHWLRATAERPARKSRRLRQMPDEEKILDGRTDVNIPALLTKDVKGG